MKKKNISNISLQQLKTNKIKKHYYNTEGVKKADNGKFKEAVEYFTKAIKLEPEDSLSYFNRATVKMNIGDVLGAMSDFKLSASYRLNN